MDFRDGLVISSRFTAHERGLMYAPNAASIFRLKNEFAIGVVITLETVRAAVEVAIIDLKEMIPDTFGGGKFRVADLEEKMLVVWGRMSVDDARKLVRGE